MKSGSSRLRIIALGYLVRGPLGGRAWADLHYVLALAALGHDVYFLEDSDDFPTCYDPARNVTDTDPTYGLDFAARAFDQIGLGDRWAYHNAFCSRWLGPCADRVSEICASADLLINLGGTNRLRPWLLQVPVRVFLDKDPVFTQIRNLTEPQRRERAGQHNAFFTLGENVSRRPSALPPDGIRWQATRHPMALEFWPATPAPPTGRFTTVLHWHSYPPRVYGGVRYGLKADSFAPYQDLPEKAGPLFEMAVGSPAAPRDLLRRQGWMIRDPLEVTRDLWTYQSYIRGSRAEFSVAKQGYVVSRCGWFSERSAAYLASGRPVLLQETGFSEWLPSGAGVLAFRTPEEALAGIDEINSRYEFHCRAAREIAAAYFDARTTLAPLIERAMSGQRPETTTAVAEEMVSLTGQTRGER